MNNKKKLLILIIIMILCPGLIYVSFRFYRAYKAVEVAKKEFGYKTPIKNLQNKLFTNKRWEKVLIDADITYTDGAHNIIPFDLDNDGKVELIADSYRSDTLDFYKFRENPRISLNWQRYIIDSSVGGGFSRSPIISLIKHKLKEKLFGGYVGGAHYITIADINNDGRSDLVIAGDKKENDIICYIAPIDITKVSNWRKFIIYKNNSHRTYQVDTGDIDGDGYQDVVFVTKTDNSIGWLKNNIFLSEWPVTWINNNCIRSFNARVADVNDDGQNDIISSEDNWINGGKLHLYRYINNPLLKENWIDDVIACFPKGHGVSVFEIVDIDSDGDLDVITANHQGDVYILENPYPDNVYGEWNKYKINNYDVNSGHDFREIDTGDIDSDGDLDIIVADEGKNMVIWFENKGNTFYGNWIYHIIDKSDGYLKWCHCVEVEDIDGDGYLDIAISSAGSNVFIAYFYNTNKILSAPQN